MLSTDRENTPSFSVSYVDHIVLRRKHVRTECLSSTVLPTGRNGETLYSNGEDVSRVMRHKRILVLYRSRGYCEGEVDSDELNTGFLDQ